MSETREDRAVDDDPKQTKSPNDNERLNETGERLARLIAAGLVRATLQRTGEPGR
jgi:hypothetical protein